MTEQQLRRKNLYYYSLLSEYIDTLDAWRTSKGIIHKQMLDKCKRLESLLRTERDKFAGKVQRIDVFDTGQQTLNL